MKKILIVITTAFVEYGGLTTVVMNYLRVMSKEDLIIDIASNNEADKALVDEVLAWGGRYFNLGKRKNVIAYRNNLKKVLKAKHYDVIHVHGNSSTMVLELSVAKKENIAKRIAHVHASRAGNIYIDKLLRLAFYKSFTHGIAVSKQAGIQLFGSKEFSIMNNAINLKKYSYKPQIRERIRKEFKINDRIVIGTVGKLNRLKNHTYLISVFAELSKKSDQYLLMIVGGGPLESELKQRAGDLGIADNVLFLGMCTNANEIIQAYDYFAFPSISEGLGMVLIEAQASGLPCLASDTVPKETEVSDLIQYLSLELSPSEWAKAIEEYTFESDRKKRSDYACECITQHGYNINKEVNNLFQLYIN